MSRGLSDNAICLRRWDFSETSQTVALLMREHGLIRGLAKGAKRPRSKFSGGFDLLTRGQVLAILKKTTDLALLTEWHLEQVYRAPRQSLAINRLALFMADLVLHFLDEHDPHPRTFDALVTALDALETLPTDDATATAQHSAILVRFQMSLLRDVGYQPQLDVDAVTGAALPAGVATYGFSPAAGGVVADEGRAGCWRVRARTVELLRVAEQATAGNATSTSTSEAAAASNALHTTGTPEDLERATRLLAAYARELLGRQLPSMTWLFPDLRADRSGDATLADQAAARRHKPRV